MSESMFFCHDYGNYYTEKHLKEACLQFQRFSPMSSVLGAWHPAGMHNTECSTSVWTGSRKRESH